MGDFGDLEGPGLHDHHLEQSASGKYVSLCVELIVYDETERMHLYAALRNHRATHLIL